MRLLDDQDASRLVRTLAFRIAEMVSIKHTYVDKEDDEDDKAATDQRIARYANVYSGIMSALMLAEELLEDDDTPPELT